MDDNNLKLEERPKEDNGYSQVETPNYDSTFLPSQSMQDKKSQPLNITDEEFQATVDRIKLLFDETSGPTRIKKYDF